MFDGILQKFPAAQGMASALSPYQQHNVMLDDSITSVGEYLSRELLTRAPYSREIARKRFLLKLNWYIIFDTKFGVATV